MPVIRDAFTNTQMLMQDILVAVTQIWNKTETFYEATNVDAKSTQY